MFSCLDFIQTPRLMLFPCSHGLACAAVTGRGAVQDFLRSSLNVKVGDEWPGDDIRDFFPIYADLLQGDPEWLGWGIWLIVRAEDRTLIGDIGFKGKPDIAGVVEIGYSVIPSERRHGYASEAATALISWGLGQPSVTRIRAECYAGNAASIGVLRRAGLRLVETDGYVMRWEIVTR